MILTGDFNRWDSLWGGRETWGHTRQGEASEIVHLISDLDLQLLLLPGTPTYYSSSQEGIVNAPPQDLIFASERLNQEMVVCKPYENQYGSDHMAIETVFSTNTGGVQQLSTRYLFSDAPWDKIRDEIRTELAPNKAISADPSDLDQFTSQLMETGSKAIDIHIP